MSAKSPLASADEAYDAIVLGAGVSGLVAASVLLDRGSRSVLILDEFERLGGNHVDVAIDDYTFDIGSFFFQDDSPFLLHFPEILGLYLPGDYTTARVSPQGRVSRYPISLKDDVLGAGPTEWVRIVTSLLKARTRGRGDLSARDFADYWLGRRFVERSGLANYMRRFYGVDPTEIEADFARKRMGWISANANLGGLLRQRTSAAPSAMNRELVRPREGFHALYDVVRSSLVERGATFGLGERLSELVAGRHGAVTVRTDRRAARSRTVVSTIPVDRALSLAGLPSPGRLSSVDLLSLFYSFDGRRGFADPVLYNFHARGAWKRVTMHSDFYGRVDGREYFSVEVNAAHVGASASAADEDFRAHVEALELFAGDLRLEGHRGTPNAYPIYTGGATEAAAAAVTSLKTFGVLSFGRQGGFDYQPTARQSTVVAEAAIARITDDRRAASRARRT